MFILKSQYHIFELMYVVLIQILDGVALKRNQSLCSKALRTYGHWIGTSKLKNPDTITAEYLLPAVNMAETSACPSGEFS